MPMAFSILVVDDDPDTCDALHSFLEREGHEVATAHEGGEALRHLEEHGPPGLILLDLGLPGLDGWGFMRELARHPRWVGTPVVVLTAEAGVSAAEVIDLGADGLLLKPVEPDELLATVDRYCWAG
jgi:CheY-like chemotaxis protein